MITLEARQKAKATQLHLADADADADGSNLIDDICLWDFRRWLDKLFVIKRKDPLCSTVHHRLGDSRGCKGWAHHEMPGQANHGKMIIM